MDTEGADHLQGGEVPMLTGIVNALRGRGLQARGAIADTWGAAHAFARATRRETIIVPVARLPRPSSTCRFPAFVCRPTSSAA